MPIIFHKTNEAGGALAVWKITEEESELLEQCTLSNEELKSLESTTHPLKRLELLSGKRTVKYLVEQSGKVYHGIHKDEFGKPFLVDQSAHISISHSYPYAAAIIDPEKPVGIDMELPKDKIRRIANKFLSSAELEITGLDLEKLCIFWSGKEAVYKEYGRKSLVFKDNIHITKNNGGYHAYLILDGEKRHIPLELDRVEKHILCYTR